MPAVKRDVTWTTLQVGSTQVPVVLKARARMGDAVGYFVGDDNRIEIRQGLSDDIAAATVMHEIFHAAGYHAGFAGWSDERIINPLSAAVFDCLHRNGLFRMPMQPPNRRSK